MRRWGARRRNAWCRRSRRESERFKALLDCLLERAGAANMALRRIAPTLRLEQTGQRGLGFHLDAYAPNIPGQCRGTG